MKVKELIARLRALDQEMEVTTACYDYGLAELNLIHEVAAIELIQSEESPAKFRAALRIDESNQITVLCCGPSDPSLVVH